MLIHPYCKQQVMIMAKKKIKQLFLERRAAPGQALVEFALIIGFVLGFAFIIIESGRMFHAWQTVQSAAREAGRYALTGQYDQDCLNNSPPCLDPRVAAIRTKAQASMTGISIDPNADYFDAGYFYVEVLGVNQDDHLMPDYAGAAGKPVFIRVTYRIGLITPFVSSFISPVRLIGSVMVNNENFDQIGSIAPGSDTPVIPNPPPPAPPRPDLQVSKSSSPETVVSGGTINYSIYIDNIGYAAATDISAEDELPDGTVFVSASSGCTHDGSLTGGVVSCPNLGSLGANPGLAPDPSLRIEVVITVLAPATIPQSPHTIINSVTVSAYETELSLANNTATAETTIISPGSDMQLLQIYSSPNPVVISQPFFYEIIVRNNGPNPTPATGVRVTTPIAPGLTFVNATPSQGICNPLAGNELVCELGDVADGAVASVRINVIAPDSEAVIVHEATVSAETFDPLSNNNSDNSTTYVSPPIANLNITKTGTPSRLRPNTTTNIIYTIQVTNQGPAPATDVVVVDQLPPNVNFISANPSQGSCGGVVDGKVECNLGTILAPAPGVNNMANITLVVKPTAIGILTNRADVTANEFDPDVSTGSGIAFAQTVVAEIDLHINKTASHTSRTVGQYLVYTLRVGNFGPSPATNVQVSDLLPQSAQFSSVTTTRGVCGHSGGTPGGGAVNCNLGTINPGDSLIEINITVIIIQGSGSTPNTGTVTASFIEDDRNLANNSSTVNVTYNNSSTPFITASPAACGDPGQVITLYGYNWDTGNNWGRVEVRWPGNPSPFPLFIDPPTTQWNRSFTIPNVPLLQTYQITVFQDGPGSNSKQASLSFRVPCPKPDLTISDLEIVSTTPYTSYHPIEFTAVIANEGDVDALSQFFVGIYVIDPDDPTHPTPIIGTTTHISSTYRAGIIGVSGLPAGESVTVTLAASGLSFPEVKTYAIYAVVDSDPGPHGFIKPELYETNNIIGPFMVTITEEGNLPPPGNPAEEKGMLVGLTEVEGISGTPVPQPFTTVRVYDEDGILIREITSNQMGVYVFEELPVGAYTVAGCSIVDGTSYARHISGVVVQEYFEEGDETVRNLLLIPGVCFNIQP
jgi:uncharacterized repeat protein (TIGR01451 family)